MQMGVNPNRLRLEWVDKGEVTKFEKAVSTFMDDIKELGPVTFQSA